MTKSNRSGLTRPDQPVSIQSLGTGSEIFWIEYICNGTTGKTSMCPNAPELTWMDMTRKYGTIKTFEFKILKQLGKSQYYLVGSD